MPLSARHRSTIYQKLKPILGDQETEALLLNFPSGEADEPITRDFLRAELTDQSAILRTEMAEVRTELTDMHAELRAGLAETQAVFRAELAETQAVFRAELADQSAVLRAELADQSAVLQTKVADTRIEFRTEIHRQTVWLLGINVTTMTTAVALARLVS